MMQTHTDNTLTQKDMINQAYKKLTAEELVAILSNTTITGKYYYNNSWYKYRVNSFSDGTMEGQNDTGTYDEGRGQVNDDGSMSTEWDGYWEDWTGVAYRVNNEVIFFDTTTHKWKTTYTLIEYGELPTDAL